MSVEPYREACLFGGIYVLTWVVPTRGTMLPQHSHAFDHVSYVVSGVVRVWADDVLLGDYAGPRAIKIAAGVFHRFLTMTDRVTIACIHNADHADDEPALNLELED